MGLDLTRLMSLVRSQMLIPLWRPDKGWIEDPLKLCFMLYSIFWLESFIDSIDHDFLRSDNLRVARHDRLGELDEHWLLKPVMVCVVISIPTGGQLCFCWSILKPSISTLHRNVRFLLQTKTSNARSLIPLNRLMRSVVPTLKSILHTTAFGPLHLWNKTFSNDKGNIF